MSISRITSSLPIIHSRPWDGHRQDTLQGLRGEEGIAVSRLRFSGKGSQKVLFRLGAFQVFHV